MKKIIIASLCIALAGCSNAKYSMRDSTTTRVTDAGMRYGSILAAGAAGAYGGYVVGGKSPVAAVAGGVGAAGLMYAFNKFTDGKRQSAYDAGVEDGANAVRAQILNDVWTRDAVYGNGKTQANKKAAPPFKRRVYVPSRTVNGVLLQGGYQEVDYYP